MLKNLILLFFFSCLVSLPTWSMNADTINQVDPVSGRKIGYWIVTGSMSKMEGYNQNDKVEEGIYINSRKTGVWTKYWPNGKSKSKIKYKNGRSYGDYATYFQNGKVEEKGTMNGGLMTGDYELYWPNGQLRQEKTFNSSGEPEGEVALFYANGQAEIKFNMAEGKESGEAIWYYENGDLKKEVNYEAGVAAKTKEYEIVSPVKEYVDPSIEKGPKLKGDFNIANSNLIDNYGKTYDNDKNILMDGEFRNGYLYHGRHYIYDEYGLLKEIKVFKNGVYVGNGIIGKNGKL